MFPFHATLYIFSLLFLSSFPSGDAGSHWCFAKLTPQTYPVTDALACGNNAPSYLILCSSWTRIFSHILGSDTFALRFSSTPVSSPYLNMCSRSALNLETSRLQRTIGTCLPECTASHLTSLLRTPSHDVRSRFKATFRLTAHSNLFAPLSTVVWPCLSSAAR
jgi:hypothetical protein